MTYSPSQSPCSSSSSSPLSLPVLSPTPQWLQQSLGSISRSSTFISFWVVALHWLAHHRIFRYIRSFDNGLLTLNLLYLFFIVIIPFATRVLDSYETTQVAILVFAVPQVGASLMNSILWRYASNNRRLVDDRVSRRTIRWFWLRGLFSATVFALTVLLAFITPYLALASWFAIPLVLQYLDRRYGGQKAD